MIALLEGKAEGARHGSLAVGPLFEVAALARAEKAVVVLQVLPPPRRPLGAAGVAMEDLGACRDVDNGTQQLAMVSSSM